MAVREVTLTFAGEHLRICSDLSTAKQILRSTKIKPALSVSADNICCDEAKCRPKRVEGTESSARKSQSWQP